MKQNGGQISRNSASRRIPETQPLPWRDPAEFCLGEKKSEKAEGSKRARKVRERVTRGDLELSIVRAVSLRRDKRAAPARVTKRSAPVRPRRT